MKLAPSSWLYDDLEGCCDRYFGGWNKNKCMGEGGSGLWYVDYSSDKCVVDCEEGSGAICGGLAHLDPDELYQDPRSCCENKLPWVFIDYCEVSLLKVTWKGFLPTMCIPDKRTLEFIFSTE